MTLWILLTALTAVCAALLTIPLVRRQDARIDARTATIAVLKDQLADVDVQLAAGTIPPGDAEGLRTEIKRRMLAAGHLPDDAVRPMGSRALSGVAIGIAGLVALAAGAMYSSMGTPGMAGQRKAGTTAPAASPATPAEPGAAEVAGLITALEAKMASNPTDPTGWRMLGWSYFQAERFGDAAKAYGKAVELNPNGAGFQSAYGEALALAADGQVTPAARTAFEKAVAQDRNDARARFFLAQGMAQEGNARGAIDAWLALLGDSASDAPWVPQLKAMVTETASAAGIDITARLAAVRQPASGGASVAPPPVAAPIAPGPSAGQVAGAAGMAPADRQAMITGMVDRLAARLAANPRDEAGWLQLIRSRSVLGDVAATRKARDDALKAFADDPAATARIKAAAAQVRL